MNDEKPNWISLLVTLNYHDLPDYIRDDVSRSEFLALVDNAIRDYDRSRGAVGAQAKERDP